MVFILLRVLSNGHNSVTQEQREAKRYDYVLWQLGQWPGMPATDLNHLMYVYDSLDEQTQRSGHTCCCCSYLAPSAAVVVAAAARPIADQIPDLCISLFALCSTACVVIARRVRGPVCFVIARWRVRGVSLFAALCLITSTSSAVVVPLQRTFDIYFSWWCL